MFSDPEENKKNPNKPKVPRKQPPSLYKSTKTNFEENPCASKTKNGI